MPIGFPLVDVSFDPGSFRSFGVDFAKVLAGELSHSIVNFFMAGFGQRLDDRVVRFGKRYEERFDRPLPRWFEFFGVEDDCGQRGNGWLRFLAEFVQSPYGAVAHVPVLIFQQAYEIRRRATCRGTDVTERIGCRRTHFWPFVVWPQ